MRRCTNPDCKTMHFPRTDPAVIMLVERRGAGLLGRNKRLAAGMYSTLAGFVEPGESLEDAVAREVLEETGIEVGEVDLPFVAAVAVSGQHHARLSRRGASTEIAVDYGELEDARWFARDWLLSHVDDNTFRLPRLDSIARRLVEDWLAGRR